MQKFYGIQGWWASISYFYSLMGIIIIIMATQIKSNQNISGIQPSNYEQALEETKNTSNRYFKGDQVPYLPELGHFKMYGAGTYLFFSFLKHSIFLFIILTVISVVPIGINIAKGTTFKTGESGLSVYLTRTSLGSHKYSNLTGSTAYQDSITYKVINVVFDIASCFIFLIFCLYWEKKSHTIEYHVSHEIKLQSTVTVEVSEFPKGVKEKQIEDLMNKFGKVTEIIGARDYTEEIELSKQLFNLEVQKKEFELEDKEGNSDKISKHDEQIKSLINQLKKTMDRDHKIIRFYVQYENSEMRAEVLKKFQPYQKILSCCKTKPQQILLNGKDIEVIPCNTEPSGVMWQNAHFTWKMRIPRYLIQIIIILGIVVGGFFFISFLNILVPPIDSDVDTTNYTEAQIKALNNVSMLQAWCIQRFVIDGKNSPYYKTCASSWQMYVNGNIISISISVIIVILCQVIKEVVGALADWQRFRTRAEKSVSFMTSLFVMELLTTTLITFLMQANIFGLSILQFWKNHMTSRDIINNITSMSQYKDLASKWYKDIGYQIWFNIFVMIFLPQLTKPFMNLILEKYRSWRGKKELVQSKMVSWLESFEFEFQANYSEILVIIGTGFIFGGGIQLMMAVVLLCLTIRYFYYKYIFIRFSKVPVQFNGVLNERLITIMKVILIIRCFISIYMYGADNVFAMEKSAFMVWASSLGIPVFQSIFIILSRFLLTWYYTIFVVIFILILIFKDFLRRGIKLLKKWRAQGEPSTQENRIQNDLTQSNHKNAEKKSIQQSESVESWISNEGQQVYEQRQVLKSYKIQNNNLYTQLFAILNMETVVDYSLYGIPVDMEPAAEKRTSYQERKKVFAR